MSDSTRINELRKEIEVLCNNCDRPNKEDIGNIILSAMVFGFGEGLKAPSANIPSGIDLADYVPKDFHDKTCEAMAKRHTEEIQRLMPKQGEWKLFYESKDGDNVYKCSCCRFITVIPYGIKLFSFCPNCGADMREVRE